MDRISTASIHNNTVARMNTLMATLADASRRVSGGQTYDSFVALGVQINRVQDLENTINGAARYRDNNTVAITRLNTMDGSVAQMEEIASDIRSALASENSSSANTVNLTELARSALEKVESALNARQAGRSLFAGSKTDHDAVGDLKTIRNEADGVANADYYNGDAFLVSIQASDTQNVEYGITAADPAFQDLIAAMHKAIDLDASGDHADALEASGFIESAILGLADVRTRINNDRIALEEANTQHNAVQTQLNVAYIRMVGGDADSVVQATIEAKLNEATLTATMQTFARMSSLTLLDFLR
jgi:flagellar hook-associated protein 3 FlgL